MSEAGTIFDNIKWRVREQRYHPNPFPPFEIDPGEFARRTLFMSPAHGPIHLPHHPQNFEPLEHADEFYVRRRDGKPVVEFTDTASTVLRDIWSHATNVFYDEHFFALRGRLQYTPPGSNVLPIKEHFIIWYQGIDGAGQRTLGIAIRPDRLRFEPTAEIVAGLNNPWVSMKHGGGWHADET